MFLFSAVAGLTLPESLLLAHGEIIVEDYPRIMYGVAPSEVNFQTVKEMGVTHVHVYGLTSPPLTVETYDKIDAYLDLAYKHDLKVMFDLNGNTRVANEELEEMKVIVSKYRSHPAVGIWYLSDEPDNHNISHHQLAPFYRMIKEESPNIPVAICHAWSTNWYRYNHVQDILLHDIYPITGAPFPHARLVNQTNFTRAAINQAKGKITIPVLQFFNWQSMAKTPSDTLRGFHVKELRYPNYMELRYLCFSTISQGVKGLAFYSYARSIMTNPKWSNDVGAKVLDEVVEFYDLVKNENMTHTLLSDYRDEGYLLSEWKNDSKRFITLINTTPEKRHFVYRGRLNMSATSLWGASRSVAFSEQARRIKFFDVEPWEVLIWQEE